MSVSNLSRGAGDFRAAAGLARYPAGPGMTLEDVPAPRGPGLFEVIGATGQRAVTNVRRLAGAERASGSRLILAAAVLLGLLAAGLYVVSLQAQYRYVFAVKHESVVSVIEAVSLDAGMTVFALLALGLALAGQPARIERAAVVVCALASAGMNYAAAAVTSPRSVVAFVMPPLFLALAVDRVVAVVRRHVLGDAERSAWAALGRVAPLLGMVVLYALRFVLAPPSTAKGVRRMVLDATPVPGMPAVPAEPAPGGLVPCPVHDSGLPEYGFDSPGEDRCAVDGERGRVCGRPLPCPEHPAIMSPEKPPAFGSKREAFEWHYRRHPQFGDRATLSRVAKEIGEQVGLQWGTARTYAAAIVAGDAISDAMDAARECDEEAQ